MKVPELPPSFLELCRNVRAKRPRVVIDHILEHGFITTEELRDIYGYNHPPRAARDVREQGIPLETFRVEGKDGRKIAAYRFGNPAHANLSKLGGRTTLSKRLKRELIHLHGSRCAIYCEEFPESDLQIDHRIPFQIAGLGKEEDDVDNYMLLCGSANRAKSWSCEHCPNWEKQQDPDICKDCYWAYPESYSHVAMRPVRRIDLLWAEEEVALYDQLREESERLQMDVPTCVKDIVKQYLTK